MHCANGETTLAAVSGTCICVTSLQMTYWNAAFKLTKRGNNVVISRLQDAINLHRYIFYIQLAAGLLRATCATSMRESDHDPVPQD